jgi:hypothetical protein
MKGQTAIEYLMTYGWAILIILIVAGVLAYYGIFAPSGFLAPTARGFGQVQVLNPWDMKASSGDLTMNLQNRVGGDITITAATVNLGSSVNGGNDIAYTAPASTVVPSGSSAVVGFTTAEWIFTPLPTVGSSYTATVTITYEYGANNDEFSSTGTISGTYSA